jgi:hypothetical protein
MVEEKSTEGIIPSKIWAVGSLVGDVAWMAESLHWSEHDAAASAKSGQFIVLCPIGVDFPDQAMDAEKLYFPNEEKWTESALFRIRQKQSEKNNG